MTVQLQPTPHPSSTRNSRAGSFSLPSRMSSSSSSNLSPEANNLKKRISSTNKKRGPGSAENGGPFKASIDNATQSSSGKSKLRGVWETFEVPRKIFHSSIGIFTVWGYTGHLNVPSFVKILGAGLGVVGCADFVRLRSPSFNKFYTRVLGFLMRPSEQNKTNGVVWYLIGAITVLSILPRDIAAMSILILSWCDTSASIFGRIFGKYTPSMRPHWLFAKRKSLAGTLAAVITGAVTAYIFFGRLVPNGHENDLSWVGGPPTSRISSFISSFLPNPSVLPADSAPYVGAPNTDPLAPWIRRLPPPRSTLSLGTLSIIVGLIGGISEAIDVYGLDDNLSLPVMSGFTMWAALSVLG